MLMRAFWQVERGTYIDLGAQDPTIDSVSLAFHQRGWNGIHVEPSAHYAELLRQSRPGDLVIEAAVGEAAAVVTFFETPGGGVSTTVPEIAARHRAAGIGIVERQVPVLPLSAVLACCDGQTVHWLKLDIEGSERSALLSWGSSDLRPLIVVVEATLPLTQIANYEDWEPLLLDKGYDFAYFDGLNRYYVSLAASHLKVHFGTPPNVFDDFELSGHSTAPFHRALERRLVDQATESEVSQRDLHARLCALDQDSRERLQAVEQQRAQDVDAATQGRLASEADAARWRSEAAALQDAQEAALHDRRLFEAVVSEREAQLGKRLEAVQAEANAHAKALRDCVFDITTGPVRTLQVELAAAQARLVSAESARNDVERLREEADAATRRHRQEFDGAVANWAGRIAAADEALAEARLVHGERENALRVEADTLRDALGKQQREHELALTGKHGEAALEREASADALRQATQVWGEREKALVEAANAARDELATVAARAALLEADLAESGLSREALAAELQAARAKVAQAQDAAAATAAGADEAARHAQQLQARLLVDEGARWGEQLHQAKVDAHRHAVRIDELTAQLEATRIEAARAAALTRDRIGFLAAQCAVGNPVLQTSPAVAMVPRAVVASAPTMSHLSGDGAAGQHPLLPLPPHAIPRIVDTEREPMNAPVVHVHQLLGLHGSEFVFAAYQSVLGRAPDPGGGDYFLHRVETENDRSQILYELGTSDEAAQRQLTLAGLQQLIDSKRPGRHRFRRWLQRVLRIDNAVTRVEAAVSFSAADARTRLRSVESQLGMLKAESAAARHAAHAALQSIDSILVLQRSMCTSQAKVESALGRVVVNTHPTSDPSRLATLQSPAASVLDCGIDGSNGPLALIESLALDVRATAQALTLAHR